MDNKVVTRFAPSPTGFMHVGNLRTALYAWLSARKNGGKLILRIEDTDKAREVEGAILHIQKVLNWIGIDWDEGPDIGGPHAPYTQSERLDLYKKYAEKLIDKGLAYPDPYTEEELKEFRGKAELAGKPFLYREYRPQIFDKWDGAKPLRFKVGDIKSYKWKDLVFGDLSAGPEALDDFILIKSDGYPTYNFCHIVDDIEMGITHVIRGQEYISSIPKYLSLYEALDVKPPYFVCLPHILGKDGGKKLGKRDGAKDALEYRDEGYLPEAMMNFLALLGWHPAKNVDGIEQEVFTKEELIKTFDIERVQNSGAQWNDDKLNWINKEHIKKLNAKELKKYVFEYLPDELHIQKLVPLIAERITKFGDIKNMVESGELDFFYKKPKYDKEKLIYKTVSLGKILENLKEAHAILEKISEEDFTVENIKKVLMDLASRKESRGEILHPIRYALSGLDKSPDPFVIADILGKNETLERIKKAL